jgi:Protein of unknown function (DUF4230)
MFSFFKNIKILAAILSALIALFVVGNLISLFRGNNNNGLSGTIITILIIGLMLGALCMYLISRVNKAGSNIITESSHTVVESMKKVFKVVCAEGQISELYNYEQTKKIFSFIPSTKKALVIVKAKVLIGFDFEKCIWEFDEEKKVVNIKSFPEPEILAIESDYKYYDMEENLFDRFSRDDLNKIQANGKKQVEISALSGDLPKMASEQMRAILSEVVKSKNWQLSSTEKIKGLLTTAVG